MEATARARSEESAEHIKQGDKRRNALRAELEQLWEELSQLDDQVRARFEFEVVCPAHGK